jgi:hypothetical protein
MHRPGVFSFSIERQYTCRIDEELAPTLPLHAFQLCFIPRAGGRFFFLYFSFTEIECARTTLSRPPFDIQRYACLISRIGHHAPIMRSLLVVI